MTLSAIPVPVNLNIYQGDDLFLDLIVTNTDGTPADLSSAAAASQIRTSPGGALLATFNCTIAGNVVSLHLSSAQAQQIQGNAAWDCQLIWLSGVINTLVAGSVTAMRDVTIPP